MALERDKHTAERALLTLGETELLEVYRRMILIRTKMSAWSGGPGVLMAWRPRL